MGEDDRSKSIVCMFDFPVKLKQRNKITQITDDGAVLC